MLISRPPTASGGFYRPIRKPQTLHLLLTSRGLRTSETERDRLHFSVSTRPHTKTDHEECTGTLEEPPEKVCGKGAGVEGCSEGVEEVDREGEVRDEFGAREEE